MPGVSEQPNDERERYERIVATSQRLLALLVGGPPDGPLDLVLEMLDALLADAQELKATVSNVSVDINRDGFVIESRLAASELAANPAIMVARLTSIGERVAARHATLEQAIGDALQAFKQLAAVDGHPSHALLHDITRAVETIQSCSADLNYLGHARIDAVSRLTVSTPGEAVVPRVSAMPAPGPRDVEAPSARPVSPPSVAPPSPAIQPPGSFGPSGF